MTITWKGWKLNPSYDLDIDGVWLQTEYSLEDAKDMARIYLQEVRDKLNEYLK